MVRGTFRCQRAAHRTYAARAAATAPLPYYAFWVPSLPGALAGCGTDRAERTATGAVVAAFALYRADRAGWRSLFITRGGGIALCLQHGWVRGIVYMPFHHLLPAILAFFCLVFIFFLPAPLLCMPPSTSSNVCAINSAVQRCWFFEHTTTRTGWLPSPSGRLCGRVIATYRCCAILSRFSLPFIPAPCVGKTATARTTVLT